MNKPDASRRSIEGLFRLISSGQLEQAEQECRSLLVNHPQDVNVIGLHGAILLKLGQLDKAEQALHRAVALEPGFAKPHEDLGRLFLARKEAEKAARHFSRAIDLDGSQDSAYSGLANALAQQGKLEQAKRAHQHFLERSPLAGKIVEADRLLLAGDAAGAEEICRELLLQAPENIQVLRLLARISSERGRDVEAEELLRRIIKLSPSDYLPHKELARFLVEQSRFPEAIEMFELAISLDDRVAENFRLLGDAQAIIGKSAQALASYQLALQLHPDDPHALAGQGHMLRISGDKEGAIASYEKCTALRPEFGGAWWNLASLPDYRLSGEQTRSIQEQISTGKLSAESEIGMRFALARTSEAEGEFEAAWEQYSLGNSLKRTQINYDPVQTEVLHDAIIEQFTAGFLEQAERGGQSRPTPIFILGMPRSGSTLIEQILASHSQVEGAGELPYIVMLSSSLGRQSPDGPRYPQLLSQLGAAQLDALGKAYVYHTGVHRSLGLDYFTDKMPANFAHVGLIHLMLPGARIVDARRHPMATCMANYRQLFAQGKNHSYDLIELAEYLLEYHRMMDHWGAVLPGRVLRVNYEDVVADLEGQVRRLLEHCELPWEQACLEFHTNPRHVSTASAEQVRVPIYADAVDFWKNYESRLEPVRQILAPLIAD
jgi:Flp pilus assembly protein TadD